MGTFELFCIDTETDGLDPRLNNVIEISIKNIRTGDQKTWNLKPLNPENIQPKALQVNGANIDDLLWKTAAGKAKYKEPEEVLPDIENWLADSGAPIQDRIMVGHNINFDYEMLKYLWVRCESFETFPFVKHGNLIDTKMLALFFDYINSTKADKYNLSACIKRFGCQQLKAHGATNDVIMCTELFEKLCDIGKKC